MTDNTCMAPGCKSDIFVKKRGLCRPHYNRLMSYGDLNLSPVTMVCKWCEGPVERTGKVGPYPDYCAPICRIRAAYHRNRDAINTRLRDKNAEKLAYAVKECRNCSSSFNPTDSLAQSFCSEQCGRRYYKVNNPNPCAEDGCDRPHLAQGLCSMHYKRKARSEGRMKNDPWSDRRRANHHKRRALKRKLPADDIKPRDVYDRDNWICGICGDPVDKNIKWPDPMSPSLDHVKPLSKGGHHVWENVACSHLDCNVRKGDQFSFEADGMSA